MPVGFMNVSQPWDVQGENAAADLQRQQTATGRQQERAQAIQNQNAAYAQQMDRAANDAFAESLDERGRPNADKYIAGLKKRGAFDPSHAAGAYQYLASNMDTLAKAGQNMATMEALGITPPEFTKAPRAIEGSNVPGDLAAATPDVAPGRVPDPDFGGTMAAPKGETEVPQPSAKHWSEEAFPVVRIGATPEAAPPVPTTQYEAPQRDWVNEALASRKTIDQMYPRTAVDDFERLQSESVKPLRNAPGANALNPSTQVRDNAAAWMAKSGRLLPSGDVDESWAELNKGVYQSARDAELGTPPNRALLAMGQEGRAKYEAERLAYGASQRKAHAAGMKAQQELQKALAEGDAKAADAIIAARATTANVNGKEYAAYDPKAAQTVRSLAPVAGYSREIHEMLASPKSLQDLKMIIPTLTKLTSATMVPGSNITDGMIKEMEISSKGDDEKSMAHIASMLMLQYAATTRGDREAVAGVANQLNSYLQTLDPAIVQRNMKRILHAADVALDDHFKANLIGYKGGVAPMPKDRGQAGPKRGDVKTFPNSRKGRWDGQGWEAI